MMKSTLAMIGLSVAFAVSLRAAEEQPTPTQEKTLQDVQQYIKEQTEAGKINKSQASWRIHLPKYKTLTFPEGKSFFWNIKTNMGDMKVKLFTAESPEHASNFVYLTELGFFDGLGFHRVIPQFMAQGGCPMGNGRGSPGYRFNGEFASGLKHDRPGLLSMANAGPGTDGSQFFLTTVATPWLDGNHTIFGEVVGGMDVLKKIEGVGSRSGATSQPVVMEKVTISVE